MAAQEIPNIDQEVPKDVLSNPAWEELSTLTLQQAWFSYIKAVNFRQVERKESCTTEDFVDR